MSMTFSVMKAGILLSQVGDFATRENVEYIAKEAERVPICLVEHRMRSSIKLTVAESKNASDTASANVLVKSIQPANEAPMDNASQNQDDKGTEK
ncbi:MAG: hypothetical protein WCF03_16720 [Nitrososphaeraceae archaeon]